MQNISLIQNYNDVILQFCNFAILNDLGTNLLSKREVS